MTVKLFTLLVAALVGLVALPAPVVSAIDECVVTGANDPNGRPAAPPCVATNLARGAGADPYTLTCPAMPTDPPLRDAGKAGCRPFYIVIVPDYDGNVQNGVQLDRTIIWQENNNCAGLQRSGGGGCVGADLRFFTL